MLCVPWNMGFTHPAPCAHTHTWAVEPALLYSRFTSSHRLQGTRLKDKTGIFWILTTRTLLYKVNIAKVWSCTNLKHSLMFYRTGHLQIKSCFRIYIKNQRSAKTRNQTHSGVIPTQYLLIVRIFHSGNRAEATQSSPDDAQATD